MKKFFFLTLFLFILILNGCGQNPQNSNEEKKMDENITVSAAASLSNVLSEVTEEFQKQFPHINVTYNFGGSGTLQQQIIYGAPVDIFLFADEEKANKLVKKGLVENDTVFNLLGNQLVFIKPKDSPLSPTSLEDLVHQEINKIAVGTPEVVPAGKYAKESLENTGIWSKLEDKMIFTKDVRQVLTYVENGNVDGGFVYQTDVINSDKAKIVVNVPSESHEDIVYTIGKLKSSKNASEASAYYDFLMSETAQNIYKKHSFIVLE